MRLIVFVLLLGVINAEDLENPTGLGVLFKTLFGSTNALKALDKNIPKLLKNSYRKNNAQDIRKLPEYDLKDKLVKEDAISTKVIMPILDALPLHNLTNILATPLNLLDNELVKQINDGLEGFQGLDLTKGALTYSLYPLMQYALENENVEFARLIGNVIRILGTALNLDYCSIAPLFNALCLNSVFNGELDIESPEYKYLTGPKCNLDPTDIDEAYTSFLGRMQDPDEDQPKPSLNDKCSKSELISAIDDAMPLFEGLMNNNAQSSGSLGDFAMNVYAAKENLMILSCLYKTKNMLI